MEHWKVLSAPIIGRQEEFFNSRRSRMVETVKFWPWWQPFNSFCFQTLSFFFHSLRRPSMAPPSHLPVIVGPDIIKQLTNLWNFRESIYECSELVVQRCSKKKVQFWTKHIETFSGFGIVSFYSNWNETRFLSL